jgi:hypothetical protein
MKIKLVPLLFAFAAGWVCALGAWLCFVSPSPAGNTSIQKSNLAQDVPEDSRPGFEHHERSQAALAAVADLRGDVLRFNHETRNELAGIREHLEKIEKAIDEGRLMASLPESPQEWLRASEEALFARTLARYRETANRELAYAEEFLKMWEKLTSESPDPDVLAGAQEQLAHWQEAVRSLAGVHNMEDLGRWQGRFNLVVPGELERPSSKNDRETLNTVGPH